MKLHDKIESKIWFYLAYFGNIRTGSMSFDYQLSGYWEGNQKHFNYRRINFKYREVSFLKLNELCMI